MTTTTTTATTATTKRRVAGVTTRATTRPPKAKVGAFYRQFMDDMVQFVGDYRKKLDDGITTTEAIEPVGTGRRNQPHAVAIAEQVAKFAIERRAQDPGILEVDYRGGHMVAITVKYTTGDRRHDKIILVNTNQSPKDSRPCAWAIDQRHTFMAITAAEQLKGGDFNTVRAHLATHGDAVDKSFFGADMTPVEANIASLVGFINPGIRFKQRTAGEVNADAKRAIGWLLNSVDGVNGLEALCANGWQLAGNWKEQLSLIAETALHPVAARDAVATIREMVLTTPSVESTEHVMSLAVPVKRAPAKPVSPTEKSRAMRAGTAGATSAKPKTTTSVSDVSSSEAEPANAMAAAFAKAKAV